MTEKKTQHVATYASDKRNGGYLVRVIGPHAKEFLGREVPVQRNDGETNFEKLTKLVTQGIDNGEVVAANAGKPYALYKFEPRPRVDSIVEF